MNPPINTDRCLTLRQSLCNATSDCTRCVSVGRVDLRYRPFNTDIGLKFAENENLERCRAEEERNVRKLYLGRSRPAFCFQLVECIGICAALHTTSGSALLPQSTRQQSSNILLVGNILSIYSHMNTCSLAYNVLTSKQTCVHAFIHRPTYITHAVQTIPERGTKNQETRQSVNSELVHGFVIFEYSFTDQIFIQLTEFLNEFINKFRTE